MAAAGTNTAGADAAGTDAAGAEGGDGELGRSLAVSLADAPPGSRTAALTDRIRSAITNGVLPTGTPLPASRTLASDLGVSRGVVVRAYEQLTAEGYLTARQGRGTEVADVRTVEAHDQVRLRRPETNPGLPAGSSFPREVWLRAATRALRDLPDAELGYPDPAGHPRLREELSRYLGRVRAVVAPPDRILVVNGFAQATRLLADVLRPRGIQRIAVEDPGSVGLRDQLTRAGMSCVPVPVDQHGLRVDELATTGARVVVVTPAHQFPTGVVMSPERRHELLRWAERANGLVVEDDYDAELRYDRAPVGAVQGLDPERVLHGGSVSKTLAPGLRLGWLVVPDHLTGPLIEAKYATDLATGVWEQVTLADLLARGEMDRHLRRTALRYRARRDRLVAALADHLPTWEISGTAAGLHLLVELPDGDQEAVADTARRCGLDARPLAPYASPGSGRSGLVIGYGHQPPDALAVAVTALARALARSG